MNAFQSCVYNLSNILNKYHMKTLLKLIIGLLFTTYSLEGFAQKTEPVCSIVRQIHDFDWYETQAKAWKQEIDNGSKNNMAWVYFFNANKYAAYLDKNKWESKKGSYFISTKEIMTLIEKAIPQSFEYYYLNSNDNTAGSGSGEANILKAQSLRPNDPLLFPWLMNHYQFKNDKANIEEVSKRWMASNEMPEGVLTCTYNKLMSVEPNAILFVNGDNDTYPFWILQNAKKIRTDVLILNVSLLNIDEYRERIFKENNIPSLKWDKSFETGGVIKHVIENVKNRPIYVSIHLDNNLYMQYADKMYLTGLTYKYSEKPFDNLAVIQNNVENKFLLDNLKIDFSNDYSRSVVNNINLSYLGAFLKLYEHYNQCGELQKAQRLKDLAKTVSDNAGDKDWMKYFEK